MFEGLLKLAAKESCSDIILKKIERYLEYANYEDDKYHILPLIKNHIVCIIQYNDEAAALLLKFMNNNISDKFELLYSLKTVVFNIICRYSSSRVLSLFLEGITNKDKKNLFNVSTDCGNPLHSALNRLSCLKFIKLVLRDIDRDLIKKLLKEQNILNKYTPLHYFFKHSPTLEVLQYLLYDFSIQEKTKLLNFLDEDNNNILFIGIKNNINEELLKYLMLGVSLKDKMTIINNKSDYYSHLYSNIIRHYNLNDKNKKYNALDYLCEKSSLHAFNILLSGFNIEKDILPLFSSTFVTERILANNSKLNLDKIDKSSNGVLLEMIRSNKIYPETLLFFIKIYMKNNRDVVETYIYDCLYVSKVKFAMMPFLQSRLINIKNNNDYLNFGKLTNEILSIIVDYLFGKDLCIIFQCHAELYSKPKYKKTISHMLFNSCYFHVGDKNKKQLIYIHDNDKKTLNTNSTKNKNLSDMKSQAKFSKKCGIM